MIKSVINWNRSSCEFSDSTTVIELLQKYIETYSSQLIRIQYLRVRQPLVDSLEISKEQLEYIENFANWRPFTFKFLTPIDTKIKDYETSLEEGFKEYAFDAKMNVENLYDAHYELLFKLSFLCLAEKASDHQSFRTKFGLKKKLRV